MIKGLIGLELAAAGAAGEQMSLRERTVRLRLEVFKYVLAALLVLAIIGLQIAVFVISPLLFSFNLLLAALGAWRHFGRKEKSTADDKSEGDP
jgi:phosphate/sulfate permease